jgi:hypothetical protein
VRGGGRGRVRGKGRSMSTCRHGIDGLERPREVRAGHLVRVSVMNGVRARVGARVRAGVRARVRARVRVRTGSGFVRAGYHVAALKGHRAWLRSRLRLGSGLGLGLGLGFGFGFGPGFRTGLGLGSWLGCG